MVSLFQDLTFVNSIREYLEPKEWLFLMLSNKAVHESHCLWENSKKEILVWLKSRLEDPFESEYSKNNVRTYIAALESGFLVSHQGRFIVFVKNEELTDGRRGRYCFPVFQLHHRSLSARLGDTQ